MTSGRSNKTRLLTGQSYIVETDESQQFSKGKRRNRISMSGSKSGDDILEEVRGLCDIAFQPGS
jgi:hypothetical protein